MSGAPDPHIIQAEYAKGARDNVYAYVRAVAAEDVLPRRPEEYEWLLTLESEACSDEVRDLIWKQYSFDSFGWGGPVTWQDLEALAEDQSDERSIRDRLFEIECEIEDLEIERDQLEMQLQRFRKTPERKLA